MSADILVDLLALCAVITGIAMLMYMCYLGGIDDDSTWFSIKYIAISVLTLLALFIFLAGAHHIMLHFTGA